MNTKPQEITDLEKITGKELLEVDDNTYSDISFLEKMTNLKILKLHTRAKDLSVLKELKNLEKLELGTPLSEYYPDMSAIQDLIKIKHLKINYFLSNTSFINKNNSYNYLGLWLSGSNIEGLSNFNYLNNLKELDLWIDNDVDINLTDYLDNIESVSLYIGKNQVKNINFLGKMRGLKKLSITGTYNSELDISFIENLLELEELSLRQNCINDISPISQLNKLTYLVLYNNELVDISPISYLQKLTYLNLSSNKIIDASSLSKIVELKYLNLKFNDIENIDFVVELPRLEYLDLHRNRVSNIDFIRKIKRDSKLKIDLSINSISDLSPLLECDCLDKLVINLRSNDIESRKYFDILLNNSNYNINLSGNKAFKSNQENNDWNRDSFYALTDGQYGDYDEDYGGYSNLDFD